MLVFVSMAMVALSSVLSAEQNKLFELVCHETDVDEVYNAINNVEWSNANLAAVRTLWRENLNKYSKVPRSASDVDMIRLALANVLIQATRHCRASGIEMNELHSFVLSKTKSEDLSVRGQATYLIGLAGDESDIPFLVSVVESEKEGYAEGGALSISFIHSERGLDALRNLVRKVSRPSLRVFLRDLVETYGAYPLKEQSEGCLNYLN